MEFHRAILINQQLLGLPFVKGLKHSRFNKNYIYNNNNIVFYTNNTFILFE